MKRILGGIAVAVALVTVGTLIGVGTAIGVETVGKVSEKIEELKEKRSRNQES